MSGDGGFGAPVRAGVAAVRRQPRLGRRLDAALKTAEGDVTARLVVFARTYVEFAVEHRALLPLMHRPKSEARDDALSAANDRAFSAPLRLLQEARDRGDIDPDTSGRVDLTLLALLQGLTVLVATGMNGDLPLDTLVTGCIETLMSGLRPC
ncbi:WHG domain-containing protein [Streptomyces nigra]